MVLPNGLEGFTGLGASPSTHARVGCPAHNLGVNVLPEVGLCLGGAVGRAPVLRDGAACPHSGYVAVARSASWSARGTAFGCGLVRSCRARTARHCGEVLGPYGTPGLCGVYALVGLVFGLLCAVVFRSRKKNEPRGVRRALALAAACVVPALAASVVFSGSVRIGPFDSVLTSAELGSPVAQAVCDVVLMVGTTLAFDAIVQHWYERRPYMSVRTIVRSQMLGVLTVVFVAAFAACFVAITRADRNDAWRAMRSILTYVSDQDAKQDVVENYLQGQCTLMVIEDGVVTCSNNPSYREGEALQTVLGEEGASFVASLAQSGSMAQTLQVGTSGLTEIAYACAQTMDDGRQVIVQMPFSTVFDQRRETMAGASLVVLAMLAVTYALGSLLLRKVMIGPINRVNALLGCIVNGDLDELVTETESVEFASLSAQINETVDALKRWIVEAEQRMERELVAARAIQQSALPKEVPNHGVLDLYASMVPAREVGGDFTTTFGWTTIRWGFA